MIGVALVVAAVLAKMAFTEWLASKHPPSKEVEGSEDLRADINRIKLMLNIRTYNAQGDKK